MWQGWLNLILGVWLIISGFVSPLQSPANLIIVGILAAVFGFWSYKNWQGDVIGILGIWLLLCGIWFGILGPANFIIVGVLMIIAGLWEGLSHPKPTPYTP
jgi:hypothetical protein